MALRMPVQVKFLAGLFARLFACVNRPGIRASILQDGVFRVAGVQELSPQRDASKQPNGEVF